MITSPAFPLQNGLGRHFEYFPTEMKMTLWLNQQIAEGQESWIGTPAGAALAVGATLTLASIESIVLNGLKLIANLFIMAANIAIDDLSRRRLAATQPLTPSPSNASTSTTFSAATTTIAEPLQESDSEEEAELMQVLPPPRAPSPHPLPPPPPKPSRWERILNFLDDYSPG